jgi:hypothetical protein
MMEPLPPKGCEELGQTNARDDGIAVEKDHRISGCFCVPRVTGTGKAKILRVSKEFHALGYPDFLH